MRKSIIISLTIIAVLSAGAITTYNFYAPLTSGTSGQILVSAGPNANPVWLPDTKTRVTLNGESKAGSAIDIYAPTASGTSGQSLISGGSGVAPTWQTPKKWYRHSVCMYDSETWMMNVEFITNTSTLLDTKAKVALKLKEQNHISKERCKFSLGMQNGDVIYYGLYSTDGSTLYTYKKNSTSWASITWTYFVDTVQEISPY